MPSKSKINNTKGPKKQPDILNQHNVGGRIRRQMFHAYLDNNHKVCLVQTGQFKGTIELGLEMARFVGEFFLFEPT